MRIQQTDRILKESRYARHSNNVHASRGFLSRMWSAVTNLFRGRA